MTVKGIETGVYNIRGGASACGGGGAYCVVRGGRARVGRPATPHARIFNP